VRRPETSAGKLLLGIAGAALLAGAAKAGRTLRRYEVAEYSMAPALLPGDYLVAARVKGELWRGDIVVFPHPILPELELVKRIIGLPGERVTIADGRITIDGAPLPEAWAVGPTTPPGTWHVPEDAYFVLGDHRTRSTEDGRMIGPVPVTAVRWRVAVRYWPAGRIGLL
jgi:signal peptidase I